MNKQSFLLLAIASLTMCGQQTPQDRSEAQLIEASQEFTDLWFDGNAEIAVFELKQARYGEVHEGQATMIFVTEPFSKEKQVKLDNPQNNSGDKEDILKLNFTRKFNTGIYPYSMMTSVFTPINQSMGAVKVTTSAQEWCGHSFVQLNKAKSGFDLDQKSYFESEGDQKTHLAECLLEDNIWTQIRLNPSELPIGEIDVLPGTQSMRFRHLPNRSLEAVASISHEGTSSFYMLAYQDRNLRIEFESEFPHSILSWEDSYKSGWGPQARELTTSARLIAQERLPYWYLNHSADSIYRAQLGLK